MKSIALHCLYPCDAIQQMKETITMQILAYFDHLYLPLQKFKMLFWVSTLPKLSIGTKNIENIHIPLCFRCQGLG